ncbi:Ribonuclease H domain and Ribonuclease H-like domain-containing protein [Strongyloides ratti]|uniref:Ribonuclease H domain and Ribonuclease H-like domain-containing protein n=1 Tax=Strongyloides ratti TaxID=34506 RepID=A0A090MSV4_STRRB|nr:Ribonuclease H domain and Ribonuclease H-like domain-containing protein [Strongyloides ratti]CEF61393.1 Ribonuclease H domain and Ribonuclease H-like domain-containing protein [Strongyloides ratti]
MKRNSNDSAQQAEMTTLTLALEELHCLIYGKTFNNNEPTLIASDSDYVFKTVKIYFKVWENRGFKKANNETPAILKKWKGIFKRLKQMNIKLIKVRAHAEIIINCKADTAARKYASAMRVLRSQV